MKRRTFLGTLGLAVAAWPIAVRAQQTTTPTIGFLAPGTSRDLASRVQAFQRGLTALAQWIERDGAQRPVPRGHVERVVIDGQEHHHKLGVWTSNTRARRDKLTQVQLEALRELGMEWA